MSVEKVREYLTPYGVADRMREFEVSSATVELAALAVGVEGARIAKTLSFKVGEDPILIVAAGDAKVDNSKYKHVSLKRFDTVFPAVGSAASAIELTCDELEHCCGKNFVQWVDVCKGWQPEEA